MSKQEIVGLEPYNQEQIESGKDIYRAIKRERMLGKLAVVNAVVLGIGSVMFGANAFNADTPKDAAISGIVSGFMAGTALLTNSTKYSHQEKVEKLYDDNDEVLSAYHDSKLES